MASQPIMSTPVCLIENKNKQLLVNQEALRTLSGISQPVVVVAMVGMCRTGKSYLLNRLTGEQYGFPLGSTVQSETKGIWMWCVPHSTKPDHTLVLLDTEGLGDVEKGDSDNDSWIFALAVLLSSTLIYNSMGTINSDAVDKLHVRDFTLELKVDGRPITEDEYLENSLKLIPGNNPRVESSNKTRECIKHFFPKRKCFTFDRPAHEKELLSHIEDLREEQLDPNFLEQLKRFCSYILSNAITKTLGEGAKVTGKHLGTLVTTYVDAIMSGVVPCLEDAVTALAQRENSMAMQKATDHYSEQMTQRVRLPTDSVQELLDLHEACKREAISIFMEHSFKDEKQEFKRKLGEAIKKKKIEFLRQNEESSSRYCQNLIEQLSKPLMERVSAGSFFVPGGYQLYKEAKEKVVHDYEEAPRKGVMASEVLQDFHKSQEPVMDAIIHAYLLTAEQTKNETVLKELLREKLENEQKWKEYAKMRMGEDPESLKKEREVMVNALVDVLYFLMKMLQDKAIQTDEDLKKLNSKIDELIKKMEPNFFSKEFLGTLIKDIILSIICPKIQTFMGSFFSK